MDGFSYFGFVAMLGGALIGALSVYKGIDHIDMHYVVLAALIFLFGLLAMALSISLQIFNAVKHLEGIKTRLYDLYYLKGLGESLAGIKKTPEPKK